MIIGEQSQQGSERVCRRCHLSLSDTARQHKPKVWAKLRDQQSSTLVQINTEDQPHFAPET